jgi:hypothetical protein
MLARRTLLAWAAAPLGACSAVAPVRAAAGSLVDLRVIDRDRQRALPEHRHRGATWVAGRPGERYAVRLSNRSGARVLVVLSIDGVNAVSGETAATSQSGYVLAPWQSSDIVGWRKSEAEAAAFYFTALPDSYAARTGRPQHVGVIGVAVFRERVMSVPYAPSPFLGRGRNEEGTAKAEAPAAAAAAAPAEAQAAARSSLRDDKLGTGHGEREHAPVQRTAFERATVQPAEIVQVRYDSHANLVAAGVIAPPWRWGGTPDPFPGYVPDPPS